MKMIRIAAAVMAAGIAVSGAGVRAQETRSSTLLTTEHYLDWERVSDAQISPDGSRIVYTRQAVNQLGRDGISAHGHDNWGCRARLPYGPRSRCPMRYNHLAPGAHQLGGQRDEPLVLVLGPTCFEYEVLPLGISKFA